MANADVMQSLYSGNTFRAAAVSVAALLLVAFLLFLACRGCIGWYRELRAQGRMRQFAAANGMSYKRQVPKLGRRGGIILSEGGLMLQDSFSGLIDERRFHAANIFRRDLSPTIPTSWGFVAFDLPVARLPHLFLDARSNDIAGRLGLGTRFSRHQRYQLEGNFSSSFTLYCPAGLERTALYVFTPDVMACLIDEASSFDVEIVGRTAFLYRRGFLDLSHPDDWTRIEAIARTLIPRLSKRIASLAANDEDSARLRALPGPMKSRRRSRSHRPSRVLRGRARVKRPRVPVMALVLSPVIITVVFAAVGTFQRWW